jgi:hypothetical protein
MTAGQISVHKTSSKELAALLYDFDISSAKLKALHLSWLKSNVPSALNEKSKVLIAGLASRTGSDAFNFNLSKERAASVESVLRDIASDNKIPLNDLSIALGEEAARIAGLADGVEDERFRAVFIGIGEEPPVAKPNLPRLVQMEAAKMVKRRTHVEVLLHQKFNDDERGDGAFALGTTIAGVVFDDSQLLRKDEKFINEHWNLTKITATEKEIKNFAYEAKYLNLDYEWSASTAKCVLVYEWKQRNGPEALDNKDRDYWYYHPYRAWLTKF